MDFLILNLERKVLKWSTKQIRIFMASILGAAVTCIVTVLPSLYEEVKLFLSYLVVCTLMVRISFSVKKVRDLIRGVIVLYVITYCIGGVLYSIYYQRNTITFYLDLLREHLFGDMNLLYIAIMVFVTSVCLLIAVRFMRYQKQMSKEIYDVWLIRDKVSIHTMGLVDTGNCLFDPITGKPVIVVEMSIMQEALGATLYHDLKKVVQFEDSSYHINSENATKIRLIPFQSIGKKRGILPAIVLDEVEIRKDTQYLCSKKVIAALYDDVLSQTKEYQVILHKSLL